ncbi:MAG: molybdopterin-dependent oxidoreductase, partial [Gemmatimonadetes bacterium]|nr:molybdopterin-dependent oxidoreductase [Gemmatimonadota bacterium]
MALGTGRGVRCPPRGNPAEGCRVGGASRASSGPAKWSRAVLIQRPPDIPSSEITPEPAYLGRRGFLRAAGLAAAGMVALPKLGAALVRPGGEDTPTPFEDITHYNNFYEFGTGKEDPAQNAGTLRPRPWSVEIAGEVARPARYDLDDLIRGLTIQERVYRHRCVEAWSMVIPWNGFPLRDLINRVQPTSRARYVEFTTLYDTQQM